jgi:peptide/nickel transport system permease protein
MYRYIVSHLIQSALLIVAVVTLSFVFIQMAPGDPVLYLYGSQRGSADVIQQIRHEWGLDRPLWEQYGSYLHNLLIQRNLGYSLINHQPVGRLLWDMMPNTLLLMVPSILIAAIAGILLGAIAARMMNSWADYAIGAFSLVGYSTPPFWLGILFIIVFASKLRWLPTEGIATLGMSAGGLAQWVDVARHMVLPVGVLAWWYLAAFARLTRAAVLDETVKPYLTTARMKGLSENRVLFSHALRNAAKPVLTILGLYLGTMFAGVVLTETVFAWPGMGRLLFNSIIQHDHPVVLGIFIVVGIAIVLANLIIDLSYVVLDPRIHYG